MIPLSQLCTAIVDCEHKTAPKSADGTGYPLIRTSDIGRGRLDLTEAHRVDAAAYEEWTRRAIPQPGDLVLAREAPVGNVAIVMPDTEPVLGQRTVLIRPNEELVDARYLTYRLLCSDLQYWMNAVANGATVPHLNVEDIRALPVPSLPPLASQQVIGATLSAFDDLIENNQHQIGILEEMMRLLYREWFMLFRFPGHQDFDLVDSELGLTPRGWKVTKLGNVLELVYGKALRASDRRDGPVAVFGSGGHVGWHDSALVDGPGIIVGRKGSFGSVHWSEDDFYPIDTTYYVKSELPLRFVDQMLRTMTFVDSHAAVPGLSRDQAYGLLLVQPPSDLITQYEDVVLPLYNLRRVLVLQCRILQKTRDLMLPRLILGGLDVVESDSELGASAV